ncbi:MAG TPA: hypothetical protein VFX84_02085, partial [Candidatus Saccharimonadales bacterium]|nr:hypothetical protein [Candidatus Saccharimonadales bacterium]
MSGPEDLSRREIISDLPVYVKRAELIRMGVALLFDPDTQDHLPLEFSYSPTEDVNPEQALPRRPTAFITDSVAVSLLYRTMLEPDSPYVVITGYPQFSDKDDEWITDLRNIDLDHEDELGAEIIVPQTKARVTLPGVMNVFLTDS